VFTSYGVLVWLPDLKPWAAAIARLLKPGGFFYVVDHHPFAHVFYNEDDATELRPHYPYSVPADEPMAFPPGPTYTDGPSQMPGPTYEWNHGVGDILNSLIDAGLRIEFFHEFYFSSYRAFPFMERGEDGWWRLPEYQESIPLLFSVKAKKPLGAS
jgi:SAM-dependent methyltransferase